MGSVNQKNKKINVREFQHNFSAYLQLAKSSPLILTKYGRDEAILLNPNKYEYVEKRKGGGNNIMKSKFIGLYKGRKDWKEKSTAKIARELRKRAWYGE